jgi:hypothetical protein
VVIFANDQDHPNGPVMTCLRSDHSQAMMIKFSTETTDDNLKSPLFIFDRALKNAGKIIK